LWFEEGSPFLAGLSTELGDIPRKITPLLWSGENSIYERDKTAHDLAEFLSAEHARHPQATQLIIAHSHGGNIALRALHYLHQRDAPQLCGADSANPLVVTLATPFVEVHPADFGRRPYNIRRALILALAALSILLANLLAIHFKTAAPFVLGIGLVVMFFIIYWGFWWIRRRAPARQNRLDALEGATQLGELMPAQRVLVIRAVDDEASLILALSTILNYLTARFIPCVLYLSLVLTVVMFFMANWLALHSGVLPSDTLGWAEPVFLGGPAALILVLLGLLMGWRSVHGRELAVSPMEYQTNTQSTPDAMGLSKIITLVRHTYAKSLRHGIYNHTDCAKAISDWVRSQLVR
jgi:hypothetical protein